MDGHAQRLPSHDQRAPYDRDVPEPTPQDLADAIEDLGRIVARLGANVDRLADDAKADAARTRAGADVPLVVELHALYGDVTACAATARSRRERAAFESVAQRLERLLAGRGAGLVTPARDAPFDAATMEASEVVPTDDPSLDHTVESLLEAGLVLTDAGRSVRPARVIVRRYRATG